MKTYRLLKENEGTLPGAIFQQSGCSPYDQYYCYDTNFFKFNDIKVAMQPAKVVEQNPEWYEEVEAEYITKNK